MMKTELLYRLFRESAGVSTDTRALKKGELFFALSGASFNGNKFVPEAINKGAMAAVIDDPDYTADKTILVDDCLSELQALAAYHREKMKFPVLAVTGTNGKTTTKELLAAVLSRKFKVHYTKGNLNNHIGVPLTILAAPPDTELMILEMGANHPGEIKLLCSVARPDFGIITNVGTAHLEGFGSLEGVIKTKSELYEYLDSVNGTAIYNEENIILAKKVSEMLKKAVPYLRPAGHEVIAEAGTSIAPLSLKVKYLNDSYSIKTNLFGIHNLENVRAAIAAGLFMAVGITDIISAIESYRPGNNRSEIRITKFNTLICDSYNANPTSMAMAIGSFNEIQDTRKVFILGDMLELGEKSDEEHRKILELLSSVENQEIFLVGQRFSKIASDYGFQAFADTDELAEYLKINPLKGSSVLIKGSRGMALEKIYDLL